MSYGNVTGWNDYFSEHSGYRMMIHLDQRATWGRASPDCAAADMPCISTPYRESRFFDDVVGYANEMIRQFDLEASKQRLLNAVTG